MIWADASEIGKSVILHSTAGAFHCVRIRLEQKSYNAAVYN